MIKMGDKVKDVVTGIVGIVVARCDYLNGCIQMGVQPKVGKDGKIQDTLYIDLGQLELMRGGLKDCGPAKEAEGPGGPQRNTPRGKTGR